MHRARTPASTGIDSRGELGRTLARHPRSPRGRSDAESLPPSEVELFPRAPSKRGVYYEFRDRGVLDAYAREIRDRDFLSRSPASLQPRGDLAELGVDIPGSQDPGLDRMMNLPEQDALVESVRDDLVRVLQHADIELLFVRAIGADGRDVGPRGDPFGSPERLRRRRYRDHDIRVANRLLDRLRREHPDTVELLHLLRIASRLGFGSPERDHPFGLPHAEEGAKLITGLGPNSDDPDSVDFAAREEVRRQCTSRPRSEIREVAVVEDHGLGEAGRRIEDEDNAAADREAALRIGVRAGGDLDCEEPRALKVRALHVDLGTGVRDVEVDDAREARLAPR